MKELLSNPYFQSVLAYVVLTLVGAILPGTVGAVARRMALDVKPGERKE